MKFLVTVAMVGLLGVPSLHAQGRNKQQILNQKQLKQQKADAAIERFLQMSPEDRRKALAQLPPARQRQILQRLKTIELLSEDERNLLRGRLQAFSGMTADRQRAVRAELQNLRRMPREDRRRRLGSDEVKQNFSEEELRLLYDVAGRQAEQEE